MNNLQINDKLTTVLRQTSGLEESRGYLGMSQIGRCPRENVRSFLNGRGHQNDRAHQNCKRGYLIEGEFKMMLAAAGVMKGATNLAILNHSNGQILLGFERELVAEFDPRFRGHTDGETVDGELFEIKSMSSDKYADARQVGRIRREHDQQVQCYMRFGNYERCQVLYIDSGSFDHWVYSVALDIRKGDEIEDKAKRILAAIDAKDPTLVRCECGRCDTNFRYPERKERIITAR